MYIKCKNGIYTAFKRQHKLTKTRKRVYKNIPNNEKTNTNTIAENIDQIYCGNIWYDECR